jgi:hypothetical protein
VRRGSERRVVLRRLLLRSEVVAKDKLEGMLKHNGISSLHFRDYDCVRCASLSFIFGLTDVSSGESGVDHGHLLAE